MKGESQRSDYYTLLASLTVIEARDAKKSISSVRQSSVISHDDPKQNRSHFVFLIHVEHDAGR